MDLPRGKSPRYRGAFEDPDDTGYPPSPSPPSGNFNPYAQEEGLLSSRAYHAKSPAGRLFARVYRWTKGPRQPRPHRIVPVLPDLQAAPLAYLKKRFPEQRQQIRLLVIACVVYAVLYITLLYGSVSGCRVPGYEPPSRLACVSRFWRSATICGLDAADCRPFDNRTFAFRCPADCSSAMLWSPEWVGDKSYSYRSLVVGGRRGSSRPIYRGDSFICASAIHAGIFDNHAGGAGVVSLIGEQRDYPSVQANGIASANFTPSFPLSFTFDEAASATAPHCPDPWWRLFLLTFAFTVLVSLFTTHPAAFFAPIFVSIFFHVALVSDPPEYPDYMDVVSYAFRNFLPAAFVALVLYHYCVSPTLTRLTAQVEKSILWLGGCWFGASSNFTFERLPIRRLAIQDLRQPGSLLTLITLTVVILSIAIFQARAFRSEGRMPAYLLFYTCIIMLIFGLVAIPHLQLRIHHYILALLLLPGTTLQTRPSLLYQGILVGLFIDGIARWGFDSIVQTPRELFGEAINSPVPVMPDPTVHSNGSITFTWPSSAEAYYTGMAVLVNDVMRYYAADATHRSFTWTRPHLNPHTRSGKQIDSDDAEEITRSSDRVNTIAKGTATQKDLEDDEDEMTGGEYFRFAHVKSAPLRSLTVGEFSNAGMVRANGSWLWFPQ